MPQITPFNPAPDDSPAQATAPVATPAAAPPTPAPTPQAPANMPAVPIEEPGESLAELVAAPPAAPAVEAAAPAVEEPEVDLDDEATADLDLDSEEALDTPEAPPHPAVNQARAQRRILDKRLREREAEVERLRAENAALKEREIDDESIEEYKTAVRSAAEARAAAHEAQLRSHYATALLKANTERKRRGEPEIEFDEATADQWVTQQLQAQRPQLTEAGVSRIVEGALQRFATTATAAQQRQDSARVEREQREAFIAELKAEAKKDPVVRELAKGIYAQWEAEGRKKTAAQHVKRLTAAQRKVGSLAPSVRAEQARQTVPLKAGGGAPAPPKAGRSVLDQIDAERWEVGDLVAAVRSGRAGF